jgi:hypothetical protein
MFELGSQQQILQKITMKRAGNNITEQQHGLLKVVHSLNGKRGDPHCGSMANVRFFYHAFIYYCLLPPDLPFIAGSGKSILWYEIPYYKCF